jgi:hydrogenase expression/formation protein HypD
MVGAAEHLAQIRALPRPEKPVRILNVCGGHERSITEFGLRSLLPEWVKLLPGPGCPVCVCPEESIYQAIRIAMDHPITLVAFGDMLRVPANVGHNEPASLVAARAIGADIRPIASPLEAISLARDLAPRPVVFFAAGFETTLAPVAAMLADSRLPDNLFLLPAARLTWPAVAHLLRDETPFEGMIAPGHVAAIMGANEWRFVAEKHHIPVSVSGFSADSLLASLHTVILHALAGKAVLDNCYAKVVKPEGNLQAQKLINSAFDVEDAMWRGIGIIPASGYRLTARHAARDATTHFPTKDLHRRRAGEMPPGCDCAEVLLAHKQPDQCRLYGTGCTPDHPVGPCMVSDEGACHIWWSAAPRTARK